MSKTIRAQIEEILDNGYGLCKGQADKLTNSQSGWRRLNELMQESPEKYRYFMVAPKKANANSYKVYFKKSLDKDNIIKNHSLGFSLQIIGANGKYYSSKYYKDYDTAFNAIKDVKSFKSIVTTNTRISVSEELLKEVFESLTNKELINKLHKDINR